MTRDVWVGFRASPFDVRKSYAFPMLELKVSRLRRVWRHCGAARGRSWRALAPAGGRSPARRAVERAKSRSPPAPQTTDGAQTADLTTARDVTVACRPPPGTNVCLEPAPLRRQPRRPRSSVPPRSTPRTGAGPHAAPPRADPVTATHLARSDPNAAFEYSPQPPLSRCCDDHLNPPSVSSRMMVSEAPAS